MAAGGTDPTGAIRPGGSVALRLRLSLNADAMTEPLRISVESDHLHSDVVVVKARTDAVGSDIISAPPSRIKIVRSR